MTSEASSGGVLSRVDFDGVDDRGHRLGDGLADLLGGDDQGLGQAGRPGRAL